MDAKIKKILLAIGAFFIAAFGFLVGKGLHRNGKSDAETEDAFSGLHETADGISELAGKVQSAGDEVHELRKRIGESTDKLESANSEFERLIDEIEATGHDYDDSM